jgi:uncharacterized protein YbjT (DUF2867 family)
MTSDRVLVFGAAGHLGLPVARWISYHDPAVQLRLATRNNKSRMSLAQEFPDAEIIAADYLDADAMKAALDGVSAVFVVTPDFLDEKQAMENLVAGARAAGDMRVIVRIQGVLPNVKPSDVPRDMRDLGGPATQHFVARSILNDSGLPVVHLNMVAYLTDDLLRWGNPIREYDLLSMPYNRRAAWVDPADVGEAAARIILSHDDRHIGHQYDVDNGHDVLEFDEVARMLSDVLQRRIGYDDSVETWRKLMGARYNQLWRGGEEYFLKFYEFEQHREFAARTSGTLGWLLQRPPLTLRGWMQINAANLAPLPSQSGSSGR